jgi:2-phosphoglycolate phosphatase
VTDLSAGLSNGFRAVVFDLDGTLVDSYAAIHESLGVVLQAFGRPPISRDDTRRMVGHGLDILIAQAIGEENVAEGVALFRERYATEGIESTRLLPGADEVTRILRERGLPLVIASNKPATFSRAILAHLGLKDRFAVITGPDDGFSPKPAPDMVIVALAAIGAKAAEALFVGDMPVDVLTARAAEMKVAVVPTGSSTREELLAASPDIVLQGLTDLIQLLPGKLGPAN